MKLSRFPLSLLFTISTLTLTHSIAIAGTLLPVHLRCANCTNPKGLEVVHPELSWQLTAGKSAADNNLRQTAYEILVASTATQLRNNRGNLWDSGKTMSNQSIQIPYTGKPLRGQQRCWWKVRVWDAANKASAWSKPAMWTMGLLRKDQWRAHWISAPQPKADAALQGLSWIWLPGVGINAPVGSVYFRKIINVPTTWTVESARFDLTADNQFELFVNGKLAGAGQNWRQLHRISLNGLLHPGRNILAIKGINKGNAPNPAGLIGLLDITFTNRQQRTVRINTSWKISAKRSAGWKTLTFHDSHWQYARAVAAMGGGPWGTITLGGAALPIFRHSFSVDKRISHAVVYVSGLGQYDLFINGRKVGDGIVQPGWTNYRKRVCYNTYDVGRMLVPGRNTLAIMLGTGMYDSAAYTGRYNHAPASFGKPKFILQMRVTYADATHQVIISNSRWHTAPGPITFCNIYGGEDYNAQDAISGWDMPELDASLWKHAVETHGPGGVLTAQLAPPVKVMHVYKPIHITHPQPGVSVYDLGQNMAGRFVIKARGPAGSKLIVYPSELLHSNGTEWQSCAGPIWCTYTLNGRGVETFHPIFSYFGFRYVQIDAVGAGKSKTQGRPVVLSVIGQATHTSSPTIGRFSCSNNLLNRINHLITMAMVNNMVSIITDCPTREKTGWLEDTYLVGPGIMDNYFVPRLYEQTAANMRDAQWPNGMVPDFAPQYFNYPDGFINSPEWGSACVLDPWLTYEYFGDKGILSKNYPMMTRYMRYLKSRAKNNIIAFGLGDWYDLGPNAPGFEQLTTLGVTATATWYRDLNTLVAISGILGHPHAAARFASQARLVRSAFNRRFYHPKTGQYDRGSQCADAMALATGLVKTADREKVLHNLIANIHAHGDHTTAGDIGFHYVVQALTNAGQGQLLYKMATQTTPPSYGYQLSRGATSLTEAWDALPQDSQDHFMLGHIEQWFFQGLGGIRLDMAKKLGRQLEIRPAVVGNLKWVHVSYDSVLGRIVSHWRRSGNHLMLHIVIPPNAMARVYIPTQHAESVRVNGQLLSASGLPIMHHQSPHGGRVVCRVPSGDYRFTSWIAH
jgi:hypothetical protein